MAWEETVEPPFLKVLPGLIMHPAPIDPVAQSGVKASVAARSFEGVDAGRSQTHVASAEDLRRASVVLIADVAADT